MEWSREKFKKVTFGVPFFMNKEKDVFSFFFLVFLILKKASNSFSNFVL
jgi:hypothetical protein